MASPLPPEVEAEFARADDGPATVNEVTDPEVRSEIWNHPSTTWYRGQDTVARLVESAPTVELTL